MSVPQAPPALARDAHKGDAGRALIVAGSAMMPGAAILAGRGALRAGAGLVTIACQDRSLTQTLPGAIPEATYLDLDGSEARGSSPSEVSTRSLVDWVLVSLRA